MKTKIVASVAVAFLVCGVAVYVYASSGASSTELSISSTPESTSLGNDGCAKKAECDKMAEEKVCPKSKEGGDKSEADCPKSKAGCPKITEGCPLSK